MVLATVASSARLATIVINPDEYRRDYNDDALRYTKSATSSSTNVVGSQQTKCDKFAPERLNQRLAEWCVMSPSSRRLNEIACLEIDAQLNKFNLATVGQSKELSNRSKRHSKSDEIRSSTTKQNTTSTKCKSNRWEAFRGKLKHIHLPHLLSFHKEEQKNTKYIDILQQLKYQSLEEELSEFINNPDLRMLKFPKYFSKNDQKLLELKSRELGLGYQMGDRHQVVYKARLSKESYSTNQECSTPRSSGGNADDVSVNVPELALKGHESFIKSLRLRRLDSAGGKRRNMLWEVAESSKNACSPPIQQGCGGVYAMRASDGHEVAMFKPAEEERFVREGLIAGEGAVREEAAYVLDSSIGGFSGVPATAVAKLHLPTFGKVQQGAVQRFMPSKMGSLEDFGMPNDFEKAAEFVPVKEIQKVGILDVRLFNTDRHPGNILLLGDVAPYNLVPIDHGCILPSWFSLSEARFDWVNYPQASAPFSHDMLNKIETLDADQDARRLRRLGIREECIMTMHICTMLLKIAAKAGKSLSWLAKFMQRSGCLDKPSKLELLIYESCQMVGIPFSFSANQYGEEVGVIEAGILSRRPPSEFMNTLRDLIVSEVAQ